jgi:hypothetical protein
MEFSEGCLKRTFCSSICAASILGILRLRTHRCHVDWFQHTRLEIEIASTVKAGEPEIVADLYAILRW